MTRQITAPGKVVLVSYLLTAISRVADIAFFVTIFGALSLPEVAEFSLAAALAAFFGVAVDFGVNTVVIREFSTARLTLVRGSIIGAAIRAITLPASMLLVALWIQFKSPAGASWHAVQLACGVQLLSLVEIHCYQWLRSRDGQILANILGTVDCLLKAGSMLLLASVGQLTTAEQVFGVQVGYHLLLATACIAIVARSRGSTGELSLHQPVVSMRGMLRSAVPLAGIGLITALQNRFDWILVAQYLNESALAVYSVANRAYEIVLLMAGTAAVAMYPYLCRSVAGQSSYTVTDLLRAVTLSCAVLGSILAAILLPVLFEIIWPGKYADARVPLQRLMAIACVSSVVMILYYEAAARRQEAAILAISIGATIIQLLVDLLLIPRLGVNGGVLGMAGLAVVNSVAYAMWGRSRWASAVPIGTILAYGTGGAVTCVVLTSAPISIATALPSLLLIWTTATWFGLLRASDRMRVRTAVAVRLSWLTRKPGVRYP